MKRRNEIIISCLTILLGVTGCGTEPTELIELPADFFENIADDTSVIDSPILDEEPPIPEPTPTPTPTPTLTPDPEPRILVSQGNGRITELSFIKASPLVYVPDADGISVTYAPSFLVLENTTEEPIEVDLQFSDSSFRTRLSFPRAFAPEEELAFGLEFRPNRVGDIEGTLTIVSDDPLTNEIRLIGYSYPNDAPEFGACGISPNPVRVGELVVVEVAATDSATSANITSCRAHGLRIAGGTATQLLFNLVDNGADLNDIRNDGTFTHTHAVGGAFSAGTWQFVFECWDIQGNVSTESPECLLDVIR